MKIKQLVILAFCLCLGIFADLSAQHQQVSSADFITQTAPFDCNGNLYLYQSTTSSVNTRFNQVMPDGSLSFFGEANDGIGVTQMNAIGFNVEDGLIYGYL